jgi:CheY-like chemotaxis protein
MCACPGTKINAKILVVDDDNGAVRLLKLNLEAYGFDVVMAINGREGLDKAFSEAPDAIILDVRMPDLNGWQVCERLKKDPRTQAIPVIFLTAYSQKNEFERSQKLGADLFLTKPLDPEELTQKIRGILYSDNMDQPKVEKQCP